MTAPLRGRGEFFVVWVRPKQDEVEMEAGGLGPEGPDKAFTLQWSF